MLCLLKITSADDAANSRPSSESPAWMITGWPCGPRGTLNSPEMSKCRPWWRNGVTPPGRRNRPDRASAATASAAHESHSSLAVCRNSFARVYRSASARKPPRRKFSPVKASKLVTTFHAARPPLRWSSVASRRATSYGSLKVELTVAASPRWVVTAARAERTVSDSGRPTTSRSWMRPFASRSRSPSARKKKSNFPRSAVWAR